MPCRFHEAACVGGVAERECAVHDCSQLAATNFLDQAGDIVTGAVRLPGLVYGEQGRPD
jgi:hypothetical protein